MPVLITLCVLIWIVLQVVQRFSMHHCSLFPLMASARSTFIFTSHVDQPLAVWDRSVRLGASGPTSLPPREGGGSGPAAGCVGQAGQCGKARAPGFTLGGLGSVLEAGGRCSGLPDR